MLVRDITTRNLVTINEDAGLFEAGKLMDEKNVSMLVVTDNENSVVGILTAGAWFNHFYLHVGGQFPDLRIKRENEELQKTKIEIAEKRGAEFKKMKVREAMNLHCNAIREDADLIEAIHEMKAKEIRRLLVKDKNGKIVGVLGRVKTIITLLEPL